MGKKTIVATLGLNCEEVNIKLNKLEKQLDRIIEKQKLISLMKRDNSLHEKWCNAITPLKTFNPEQPKHNNITINMNGSIDADAVAEHIAKSIRLALSNI